jgi:hypothetical protein
MDKYLYQQIFYYISKRYPHAFTHFGFTLSKIMTYRKSLLQRHNFSSKHFWVYCRLPLESPTVVTTYILLHQWYVNQC